MKITTFNTTKKINQAQHCFQRIVVTNKRSVHKRFHTFNQWDKFDRIASWVQWWNYLNNYFFLDLPITRFGSLVSWKHNIISLQEVLHLYDKLIFKLISIKNLNSSQKWFVLFISISCSKHKYCSLRNKILTRAMFLDWNFIFWLRRYNHYSFDIKCLNQNLNCKPQTRNIIF